MITTQEKIRIFDDTGRNDSFEVDSIFLICFKIIEI